MRLKKKNSCCLLNETPETKGMINKVKNAIAYGKIDKSTLIKLIKERGRIIGKKNEKPSNPEKIAEEILNGKKIEETGIKPFFRLHPALKGINSKVHYPNGVLGDHKEDINKLIERML
jgi:large subunit ribosomal protein L30